MTEELGYHMYRFIEPELTQLPEILMADAHRDTEVKKSHTPWTTVQLEFAYSTLVLYCSGYPKLRTNIMLTEIAYDVRRFILDQGRSDVSHLTCLGQRGFSIARFSFVRFPHTTNDPRPTYETNLVYFKALGRL